MVNVDFATNNPLLIPPPQNHEFLCPFSMMVNVDFATNIPLLISRPPPTHTHTHTTTTTKIDKTLIPFPMAFACIMIVHVDFYGS